MSALIAHHDELARRVLAMYLKKSNINNCYEAKERNEACSEILNKQTNLLVIHIDWIFNSPSLITWLTSNKIYKKTRIIAVSTDFSLDHEKWCEENAIHYVMLPLTFSVFKVIIESNR